ncbi:MAG: hypothetical protein HQ580_15200 [Planctomycetes bacterium]|nr:hypothetical protein [Planctomycetota bacterium]
MELYERLMANKALDDMVSERIRAESLPAGFDIRLYRDGDESSIEPVEHILKEHPSYKSEWKKMLSAGLVMTCLVMTCLYESEPIGVGSVMPVIGDENKAIVWMIVSRKIENVKVRAWRVIKSALSIIEDVFGYDELWAYARSDSSASHRTLAHLGFHRKEAYQLNRVISYGFYIKESGNG